MLHQWYVDGAKILKASCFNNKTEIKWKKANKTSTNYRQTYFTRLLVNLL